MKQTPSTKKENRERYKKKERWGFWKPHVFLYRWMESKPYETTTFFIIEFPYVINIDQLEAGLRKEFPEFEEVRKSMVPGWFEVFLDSPVMWSTVKEKGCRASEKVDPP